MPASTLAFILILSTTPQWRTPESSSRLDSSSNPRPMNLERTPPPTGKTYLLITIDEPAVDDQLDDLAEAASDLLWLLAGDYEAEDSILIEDDHFAPVGKFKHLRPIITIDQEGGRVLATRAAHGIRLIRWQAEDVNLLLARWIEPPFNWEGYCQMLCEIAKHFSCAEVINLVAHAEPLAFDQPPTLTLGVGSYDRADELGIPASESEWETGMGGLLGRSCAIAGLPFIRLRAGVPTGMMEFIAEQFTFKYPGTTLTLLSAVERLVDLQFPLARERLERWYDEWLEKVGQYVEGDPERAKLHELLSAGHEAKREQQRANQAPLDPKEVLSDINRLLGNDPDDGPARTH